MHSPVHISPLQTLFSVGHFFGFVFSSSQYFRSELSSIQKIHGSNLNVPGGKNILTQLFKLYRKLN